MTSRKFELTIVVPTKLIGVVIEVLNDECDVLQLKPLLRGHHEPGHHKRAVRPHKRVTGITRTGQTGRGLILQKLKDTGGQTQAQLAGLFSNVGRAANSVSPLLSVLYSEEAAKQDDDGVWKLTAHGQTIANRELAK